MPVQDLDDAADLIGRQEAFPRPAALALDVLAGVAVLGPVSVDLVVSQRVV